MARAAPEALVLGLDRDPEAVRHGEALIRGAGLADRVSLGRGNFADFAGPGPFQGILLDLGASAHHFGDPSRGFSLRRDGPLDMRMDGAAGGGETAASIVNGRSEEELARLFRECGGERLARRIARRIAGRRGAAPVLRTSELASLAASCRPPGRRRGRVHPATRVFQALRIAVNDELGALSAALGRLPGLLADGGRLVVVSYHSLEDRMVKRAFLAARDGAPPGTVEVRTRKPVVPGPGEVARNPASRSAKMRSLGRTRPGAPP